MKIAIIGLGSIGQRHLANLKTLNLNNIITIDNHPPKKADYLDLKKALRNEKNIKAAFICSPTYLHIPQATFCAQQKINLFIEKPLSHNLRGLRNLIALVKKYKLITMMGFNYRFYPGIMAIKNLLDKNAIGKVYLVRLYGGHYLPNWHLNEDYRRHYAAQKKMGGGVILTSVSHDFDYLRFLFGEITILHSWSGKLSHLDIDVEDTTSILMAAKKNIHITLSANFIERIKKHQIEIVGSLGQIEWHHDKNRVRYYTVKSGWQEIKYQFQTNDMYLAEIKYFLHCLKNDKQPKPNIYDGLEVLELSLRTKKFI